MRTLPKFLAVMSIISLCLALLAGIELLWGFGGDLGIATANHFHILNKTGWVITLQLIMILIVAIIFFLIVRSFWKTAEKMPDRNDDFKNENAQLHKDLQQLISALKQNHIDVPQLNPSPVTSKIKHNDHGTKRNKKR